jgi:hypothetical protein
MGLRPAALEVGGLMDTPQYRPQRTGWVILVLMVATNFMTWMEPLVRVTADLDSLAPNQLQISLGACLLAAALVTATWLTGRHSSSPLPRALGRPRLVGFRIALLCAAVNILFGIVAVKMGTDVSIGARRLALVVESVWFLAVLPAQVFSAYLTGRGTVWQTAQALPPLEQETVGLQLEADVS